MTNRKIIAYIDIYSRDEIMELAAADKLPQTGDTVTFAGGDAKGDWHICGVKPVNDEVFDALVFVDERT